MIITRILPLPTHVKAFVSKDSEDDYNVYINANISYEEQKLAYSHELSHIENGHLTGVQCVKECEQIVSEEIKSKRCS